MLLPLVTVYSVIGRLSEMLLILQGVLIFLLQLDASLVEMHKFLLGFTVAQWSVGLRW